MKDNCRLNAFSSVSHCITLSYCGPHLPLAILLFHPRYGRWDLSICYIPSAGIPWRDGP